MLSPLISIIIPAHNEEKSILKTIQSIKKSDYKNYEIIVICDNCQDDTYKLAKKVANHVFKVNFKIASKSRNFGAKKAKGKILVFNDADTLISKNYLSSIEKAVKKRADYGTAKWISESGSLFGKYWAWGNNRANKKEKTIAGNCFATKSSFNKVKGFNDKLSKGEDTDFGDRLKEIGKKHVFIENAYYNPSERRFKNNLFKFWINALYESWLYQLNKEKYIKKFSHS